MGTAAHSNDLRSRVVEEILAGASRRQAAERFKVSAASAVRWAQLHSQTGGVQPRPRGGKSRSPLEWHAAWLLVLRLMEAIPREVVTYAVAHAIQLGAIGFDAVIQIALARVERRPARLDLTAYPHLPKTRVKTTSAADYAVLVAGSAA